MADFREIGAQLSAKPAVYLRRELAGSGMAALEQAGPRSCRSCDACSYVLMNGTR